MYNRQPDSNDFRFSGKLHQWDQRASVRRMPRRVLLDTSNGDKVYFVPELAPICRHPIIADLGPSAIREILVQHLYGYLDFTAVFEQEVINPVVAQIAKRAIGVELPEPVAFDAYKIYCDEAYHALFSFDLKRQVELATAIPPNLVDNTSLSQRLEKILSAIPAEFRLMARVFFVITYETLISALLARMPKDERVDKTVRQVVADHADDEGQHHIYFSSLLTIIWPQLTWEQRSVIGPLLPHFIVESLRPNYPAIEHMLFRRNFEPDQIRLVMEESYPPHQLLADARITARATLNLFERTGIMADPITYKSFQAAGLVK